MKMNFNPNNIILIAFNSATLVIYLLLSTSYASTNYSLCKTQTKIVGKEAIEAFQSKLRSEFLQVLRSRRPAQVPLTVQHTKPVENPLYQISPPTREQIEILESAPTANIKNLEELLQEENLYLNIEKGEQGRLPVLILKMKESDNKQRKRPAVIFLHSNKESLRPLLKAYASRGYIAISVDARYHGERATNTTAYRDALISAWKTGETMPFVYDTVWDLIKFAEYLTQRADIDPSRVGITGISLGGINAWFAAFAETRYAAVVPVIGVQGFRWAIDNDQWQGRVNTTRPVFEVARHDLGKSAIDKEVVEKVNLARHDLGKSAIDKEVVEKVWDRIAPGLDSQFDSPYSIPAIAPRPLLILNGVEDPQCPIGGLKIPIAKAKLAYGEFYCLDNFKFIAEPGIGHQITRFQMKASADWFDKFLNP